MPSTDRKLELKAKTSVAQTASQAAVYAKGLKITLLTSELRQTPTPSCRLQPADSIHTYSFFYTGIQIFILTLL
jgi:hypothetical protein